MKRRCKEFFGRKKSFWLLCYPLSFLSLGLSKRSSYIAEEVFAKRIFKVWSQVVSFITGILPFSLAELMIIAGPFFLVFLFLRWLIRIIENKEKRRRIMADGFYHVLLAAGAVFFLFVVGCGVNYYRYPFSYYSNLTIEKADVTELYLLCQSLAERANEAREALGTDCEDENGIYTLNVSVAGLGQKAKKAFEILAEEYPILSGGYPAPKPVFFSRAMSYMGITGIFIPFTMEANVNIDVPDYSVASTMCHELAHLHGFIREDEANYIAYLATTHSGDADLVYSGLMEALIITGNALYAMDQELYYEVRQTYCQGINRDLYANSQYWKQFADTPVSNIADKVNDTYLKANNQSDGVQSYGRMVDLLLAEYRRTKREVYPEVTVWP